MITAGTLRQIAPNAKGPLLEVLAPALNSVLPQYDITTPLRIAHFLAQAALETDGFKTLEEYGGAGYFRRYDGRADLGNTEPGDGARYHGRGIFQLTGRSNYRQMGARLGYNLESNPEMAADPVVSVRIAGEYWKSREISAKADADDLEGVTRKINGGLNGLADRRTYLDRAKRVLAAEIMAPVPPRPPSTTSTIRVDPAKVPPPVMFPAEPAPPTPWWLTIINFILSLFGRKA